MPGVDPSKVDILLPAITQFQEERTGFSLSTITIAGGKGFLVLLKKKKYRIKSYLNKML